MNLNLKEIILDHENKVFQIIELNSKKNIRRYAHFYNIEHHHNKSNNLKISEKNLENQVSNSKQVNFRNEKTEYFRTSRIIFQQK